MSAWERDFAAQGFLREETHVSEVYLKAHDAWKIKKPLDFGFLDYSSPEKRKAACEAEVRLNRRFSPSIYLGVEPVVLRDSGGYAFGGEGAVVDWAVHMVRMPEADRADLRLARGRLDPASLRALAGRLAAFHAASPAGPVSEAYGSTAAVSRNLEENFTQSRPFLPFLIGAEQAAELESRMRARFRLCAPALESRYLGHRIRDGHGDLRLCQIYVDGSGRSEILDCVEFNDRFRYGDPAGDVAFLSMDLAFHGHPEAAEGFLAAYAAASGDFGIYAVVDFYQAYRACVRGKVEGLRAAEMGPGPGRSLKEEEARAYFRFALVESLQPLPAIIAIGGGIGTGKTTLASRLGELLCAPVLSSDPLRKRMSGIGPLERRRDPLWQGLYAPENTRKVYAEAVRLAGLIGDSGRSVIVDASFRGRAERKAIRDAALEWGRPFLFVECRADPETCRARLRRRAAHPNASDGSEREFESFLDSWEPVQDIPSAERLVLDTAAPLPECVDRAMRACLWMRARTAHANLA